MAKPRKASTVRGDLLVLGAVLALALGWLGWRAARPQTGRLVIIESPAGTQALPLSQDATLTLTGRDGITVTVEIADGAARFAASGCPDRVCVNTGRLARPGATAACVPAGVVLRVEGGTDSPADGEVDAVAR